MTTQMFQRKCLQCERTYPAETLVCEDDGTQLAAILTQSLVGDTLGGGKYELLEELGRGGMGVVFRARHKLMDRTVAIKMLIDDLGRDETALQRFHVEAKAAAALNHSNIIRIYDFDVSQHGFPFIVMDYLQGEPLDVFLEREKHMDWKRAQPLFIKVCEALGHAHRRQVVHRDIKPSNIMICVDDDEEEKPVVLDFGIAKLFTAQTGKAANRLTKTGEIFGSPLYMSPEQCLGQSIDPRSDIYSLGCLIHETLTGQAPFERSGFLQVILAHVNAPAPTLEESAPDMVFPPRLTEIIGRAIAKDCTQRYETMQEFKKALAEVDLDKSPAPPARDTGAGDSGARKGLGFVSGFASGFASGMASGAASKAVSSAGSSASSAPEAITAKSDAGGAAQDGSEVFEVSEVEGSPPDASEEFLRVLAAAKNGDAEAQYDLAWFYRKGDEGAPLDAKISFYWFLKSAEQGKPQSMNCVADMYQDGEGVEESMAEAFSWRQKSAELGDALGQWNLGWHYNHAHGCDEDPDLTAYWYRKAADQGTPGAQADLGWCYMNGYGVEESDAEAFEWLLKAAEQGNGYSQVRVGRALKWGWGVEKDEKGAFEWFEQAASNGRLDGQHELAIMYFRGLGCRLDASEGYRQLRIAAQKGHPESQNYLGLCYEFGWHKIPINWNEAAVWYKKAADQNYADAEYNLGSIYEEGKGVDLDEDLALSWYRRGAENGSGSGMVALARFLGKGIACEKDEAEAIFWLKKAAAAGDATGMYRLAMRIDDGRCKDAEGFDVMELFRKSADKENSDAQFEYGSRLYNAGEREEGLKYLKLSAEQENTDALDFLAKHGEAGGETSGTQS